LFFDQTYLLIAPPFFQFFFASNSGWRVVVDFEPDQPFDPISRGKATGGLSPGIITKEAAMARLRTHPGEVLAKALDVPANRLTEIMRGTRDVSADTAIRLGRYFRTDPRFWLNLQAAHDLSKAERAHSYKKIVPRKAA
jgi:antitoxin HigA-1